MTFDHPIDRFADLMLRTIVPYARLFPTIKKEEEWKAYYLAYRERGKRHLRRFIGDLEHGRYGQFDPQIVRAIRYNVFAGGKRVRVVLVYLMHDLVGGQLDQYYLGQASLLAELPHRGSLIEDDIDDHSTQRDGRPAVHLAFGNTAEEGRLIALGAAHLLYQAPQLLLEQMPIPDETRRLLLSEYQRLAEEAREGQRLDLLFSQSSDVPTEAEYLEMCRKKCAAFEYAVVVGAVLGQANREQLTVLTEASRKAAIAFQLVDDLIGWQEGSEDYGSDLKEGKPTLPIIHALSQHSIESYQLQAYLEQLWGRKLTVRRPPFDPTSLGLRL